MQRFMHFLTLEATRVHHRGTEDTAQLSRKHDTRHPLTPSLSPASGGEGTVRGLCVITFNKKMARA